MRHRILVVTFADGRVALTRAAVDVHVDVGVVRHAQQAPLASARRRRLGRPMVCWLVVRLGVVVRLRMSMSVSVSVSVRLVVRDGMGLGEDRSLLDRLHLLAVEDEEASAGAVTERIGGHRLAVRIEPNACIRVVVLLQEHGHLGHLDDELAVFTTRTNRELPILDGKILAGSHVLKANDCAQAVGAVTAAHAEGRVRIEPTVGGDGTVRAHLHWLRCLGVHNVDGLAAEIPHAAQGECLDLRRQHKLSLRVGRGCRLLLGDGRLLLGNCRLLLGDGRLLLRVRRSGRLAAPRRRNLLAVKDEEASAGAVAERVGRHGLAVGVEPNARGRVVVLFQEHGHLRHLHDELAVLAAAPDCQLPVLDGQELACGHVLEPDHRAQAVGPVATAHAEARVRAEAAVGGDLAARPHADGLRSFRVHDEHRLSTELLQGAQGHGLDLRGQHELCHDCIFFFFFFLALAFLSSATNLRV